MFLRSTDPMRAYLAPAYTPIRVFAPHHDYPNSAGSAWTTSPFLLQLPDPNSEMIPKHLDTTTQTQTLGYGWLDSTRIMGGSLNA